METPEIIELVEKAKQGDDLAFETLYYKYENLISGQRMAFALGRSPQSGAMDEDFASICKLLFVKAVLRYDPTKSKLSTYLTNYIRWTFTAEFLKERMVKTSRKSTDEKTSKLMKDTEVFATGSEFFERRFETLDIIQIKAITGEEFSITKENLAPTLVGFVSRHSKKSASVFEKYLEAMLDNELPHTSALKYAADKSNVPLLTATRAVLSASNYIKSNLRINISELNQHTSKKREHAN